MSKHYIFFFIISNYFLALDSVPGPFPNNSVPEIPGMIPAEWNFNYGWSPLPNFIPGIPPDSARFYQESGQS